MGPGSRPGRRREDLLPQQHRVRAVHRFRRVRHRLLQRSCLHRDVLGKEPRQCDIALRIAAIVILIVVELALSLLRLR